MERRHRFCVLCPAWRDGQQSPRRPRNQHAFAAPDSELHGLHQHVDDPESAGTAALAGQVHTPRLRRPDPADLGARESVRSIRPRHEYAIGVDVTQMAPGVTTVGSRPLRRPPPPQLPAFLFVRFIPSCYFSPLPYGEEKTKMINRRGASEDVQSFL